MLPLIILTTYYLCFYLFLFFNGFFILFFFHNTHSCTVRSLWDLWWYGNTSRNMAPYRTQKAVDYVEKRFLSYLSRARKVMKKIEALLKEKDNSLDLSRLNITESRVKFAAGFDELCAWLSPEINMQQLDMRHYGDAMYVSFYDRI